MLVLVAGVAVPMVGAAQGPGEPGRRERTLGLYVDSRVVPVFAAFAAETGQLQRTVVRVCAHATTVSRAAFLRAMEQAVKFYGAAVVMRFGPTANARFKALGRPAPVTRAAVTAVLGGEREMPRSLAAFNAADPALHGLPALEHALHAVILDGARPVDPDRCRLARLVAAHTAATAAELHAEWAAADGGAAAGPPLLPAVLRAAFAVVEGLSEELSSGHDAPGGAEEAVFASATLQVAFTSGRATGVAHLFSGETVAALFGGAADPALSEIETRLSHAVGSVGKVQPANGIGPRDRAHLQTAAAEVAATRTVMVERLGPIAGVTLGPADGAR